MLQTSRSALECFFASGEKLTVDDLSIPDDLKDELEAERATFVTLTKDGELRGCMGDLLPVNSLIKDVIENTYSAAFQDPRFPSLSSEELNQIKIEISILDIPKNLSYIDSHDLIAKLSSSKPGVILKHGFHQATFLPQVWEELPEAADFLSYLCQKAGLDPGIWKNEKLDIQVYGVEKVS